MEVIFDTDLSKMTAITYSPEAKHVVFNNGLTYEVGFYEGDEIRENNDLIYAINYNDTIFSEQFLREFGDQINWRAVHEKQEITIDFIREHKDVLDTSFWEWVSYNFDLTPQFIDEFVDYLNWRIISGKGLSEDLVVKYIDRVDWTNISTKSNLSEDFVRAFKEYINWEYVIRKNKFSEQFLLDMRDYIEAEKAWEQLSMWQDLSEEFMKENGINSVYKYLFNHDNDRYYYDTICDRYNEPKLIK